MDTSSASTPRETEPVTVEHFGEARLIGLAGDNHVCLDSGAALEFKPRYCLISDSGASAAFNVGNHSTGNSAIDR